LVFASSKAFSEFSRAIFWSFNAVSELSNSFFIFLFSSLASSAALAYFLNASD
jgi:hypothetical protein